MALGIGASNPSSIDKVIDYVLNICIIFIGIYIYIYIYIYIILL